MKMQTSEFREPLQGECGGLDSEFGVLNSEKKHVGIVGCSRLNSKFRMQSHGVSKGRALDSEFAMPNSKSSSSPGAPDAYIGILNSPSGHVFVCMRQFCLVPGFA